jgi:DNA repair protein RadC
MGIRAWQKHEQPLERLKVVGPEYLSSAELMALVLRSGSPGQNVLELAHHILEQWNTFELLNRASMSELQSCYGVGEAKAAQIIAVFELSRRIQEESPSHRTTVIRSSKDVAKLVQPRMGNRPRELFKSLYLDNRNQVIKMITETEGTVNCAFPIIREIVHKAFNCFASGLVCVHNHPSGSLDPSPEDIAFTKKLTKAGRLLNIRVLDHVIITHQGYFSFADQGLMND